ncbi:protein-tyrosine phosphatase [Beauveria bassiana ARSEF 2860]|uniref:Protein-tyrosine phosphatase n=1 Tax=Beauveria bassiana (strain ARSEF 2860) TaxID=655819 RepID=J4KPT9_BEAB2|nr:protein-tyrosine phosphatase [Beauveria bassiana ARSEF 2860]EJP68034.1 protein-tyrosine phosphatase [Beauveria bassiana ARSEF 2860]
MLLGKAFLAFAWAAAAVHAAPSPSYVDMDGGAGPSNGNAAEGGLQRFEFVKEFMGSENELARSSAPYYAGQDSHQKITPETIAALKKHGVTHIISANAEANNEEIKKALAEAGITYTPLPVQDFKAATQDDFQRAWDAFVSNRGTGATLVWCGYGHGRTGTIISALQMFAEHERGQLHTWSRSDYDRNHVETAGQRSALETLQQRLQSEPAQPPALTEYQTDGLLSGDFNGIDCSLALGFVLLNVTPKTRRSLPGSVATLNSRQVTPTPMTPSSSTQDCERARDILRRKNVPSVCRTIKNIQLGLALSNDYWSGTWDRIGATLEGPAGKAVLHLANGPSRGFSTWEKVNMKASFGSESIDIGGIDKITLNAAGVFSVIRESNPTNDQWKVQDVQIRAECADPDFKAKDDKLVGLNAWYGHPGGWQEGNAYKTKPVATFSIVPGDWAFSPPCAIIKDLTYQFKLSNVYSGGTWDELSFTIGESKEIPLGVSPALGYTKDGTIDLKEVFGKDQIDIRSLKEVRILDQFGKDGAGDAWSFSGITFSATCAHMDKKMAMKKFQSVEKWVYHAESGPAWTGDIITSDWLEVV